MTYKMNIDDVSDDQLKTLKERLHTGMKTTPVQDNVLWRLIIMELERRKE